MTCEGIPFITLPEWEAVMLSAAKPLTRASESAELPEGTTSYRLRHGFISPALARGVPTVAVVQHCDTSVTMIESTCAKFTRDVMAGWFQ